MSDTEPEIIDVSAPPARRALVAGATGFVGRALVPALLDEGFTVRAMTRHPDSYDGPGVTVVADVADEDACVRAMRGCEVAYYLVHSLDHGDFAHRHGSASG